MRNERLGVDKDYGLFYVFDYRHAKCVVRLLCNNSYVRFGDTYFKQTKGIPMGINLAVFMANYYLFYYEFTFVKHYWLTSSTRAPGAPGAPSYSVGACPYVDDMLNSPTAPSYSDPAMAEFYGDAALHFLSCFRFTVRYIDDLVSRVWQPLLVAAWCVSLAFCASFCIIV
jgi:hypothetical protein